MIAGLVLKIGRFRVLFANGFSFSQPRFDLGVQRITMLSVLSV